MKLPHNKDLEYYLLSSMMNNDDAFDYVCINMNQEHFYHQETKELYNMMIDQDARPTKNLLLAKVRDPEKRMVIEKVNNLDDGSKDFMNAISQLKELRAKRQLYMALGDTQRKFDNKTYNELINDLSDEMVVEDNDVDKLNIIDPSDLGVEMLEQYYERLANPEKPTGLPLAWEDDRGNKFGFPSLQNSLKGAKPGDLIMIAAKTGVGKTAFGINLARLFSLQQKYAGYYMNVEMRKSELISRLISPLAKVNVTEIEEAQHEGTKEQIDKKRDQVADALDRFTKSNLYTSIIPDLNISKAEALIRRVHRKNNIDYVVVDYIQRMQEHKSNMSAWDELFDIARRLKAMAQTLQIPIFILAQRNENGDVEGAKKMKNECDAVLYFEPIDFSDDEEVEKMKESVPHHQHNKVQYKIIKAKLRRNNEKSPVYAMFDQRKNLIIEASKW